MKTLAIVVNNPDFFLSHRLPLANAARQNGYDVFVVCPFGPRVADIINLGFKVKAYELNRKSLNPFRELVSIYQLYFILKELNADIAHAISLKPILQTCFANFFLPKIRIVGTVTGLGFIFIQSGIVYDVLRFFIGLAFRIGLYSKNIELIFQNQDDLDLFTKQNWLPTSRAHLIRGSGVDLKKFTPSPEPSGPATIIFPARLLRDKGLLEFIAAIKLLRQETKDFRAVLVGGLDPANRAGVAESEVAKWTKEKIVEWVGHQSKMAEWYNRANIVCLPSYREGLPLTLLEASACRRAIVTTDVPGCRELITDKVTGLLVPPRDPVALKNSLALLLRDTHLRSQLAEAAYNNVKDGFSVEEICKKTLDVYPK